MGKKIICLLFLLFCTSSFSQDILNTHSISLNSRWNDYREAFSVVNKKTKEVVLLIGDKNNFTLYKYLPDFSVIDSMIIKKPANKFNLVGNVINEDEDSYSIYSVTSNYSEIHTEIFNFKTKESSSIITKLSLKKETVLKSFTQKDRFYILSLLRNKDQMKLYSFDSTGQYSEHILDFSSFFFITSKHQRISLDKVFNTGAGASLNIEKIDIQSPNSLSNTAQTRKIYTSDNQLIITFDYSLNHTQIFIIDLNTYSITEKIFSQPILKTSGEEITIKSNSFLYKNKLYQIIANKDNLAFTIKDYNTEDVVLKEYYITKNDTIKFKNSDIIQKNGLLSSNRNIENTDQFLRKITNLNIAVTAYETPQDLIVTFGGIQIPSSSSKIIAAGVAFGAVGVIITALTDSDFNATSSNYNSYINKKSVSIDCLFDQNMNHKPFEVEPIAFDKIDQFYKTYQRQTSAHTIFKYNNYFIIGYYDTYDKKYILRKFTD